ncbi:MAG: hypothetical protein ACXVUE_03300 [Solirubrobacteraceae bacterium]
MSADPGATASSDARSQRLTNQPVEEIVAVHHHSAFGMHVDPLQPAVVAEAPDDDTAPRSRR